MKSLNKNARPFKLALSTEQAYMENDPFYLRNNLSMQVTMLNQIPSPLRRTKNVLEEIYDDPQKLMEYEEMDISNQPTDSEDQDEVNT